ncbi:MAG TPA: potassium channel family protein [Bryobacteraceae bacterium]|nr:potassium channel family protein [Bryobacteraceae bacterium]
MKAFRNLRTIGALLLFVIVAATAGYHYSEAWSWFDGFYMVVTTLTTIGFEEVHPLSEAGRIFNLFVMLSGVSLLALGVGAMSQALLEFELQSFFGRRRMERENGAGNRTSRRPLHPLRHGSGGTQRGAGVGA